MWRVARIRPLVTVLAHVDDLNLVATNAQDLESVVQLLWDFERDFKLQLSAAKTKVWTTNQAHEDQLSQHTGFQATTNLDALGAQWPCRPGSSPQHQKEVSRLQECCARLERARALQINPARLAHILSTGCLSLIDFVNLPDPKPYHKIRTLVKDAFGLKSAAPEVVVCLLQKGTLDPFLRWHLAALRLWHYVLRDGPLPEEVNEVIETCKGRLGKSAVEAFRWGIRVTPAGFELGDRLLSLREEWYISRKVLVGHLKSEQAKRLAMRRPTLFAGLVAWNHRHHSKLLSTLQPLQAMILFKLWTGSIMCKHKRQQLYGESAECACGHENQTVGHLLWTCALIPPPPPHLDYRRHLPPAQSIAHLLPPSVDLREVRLWKESCVRAVKVLSAPVVSAPLPVIRDVDLKGHSLGVNHEGTYAFCRKCFVTRRARDRKWIWVKPCAKDGAEARALGEIWHELGHEVILEMARWKLTAQRPRMRCTRCMQEVWATKGWSQECLGSE